jgi:Fe-S cluster biogenesis protein NfuA
MAGMHENSDFRKRIGRIETLIQEIDHFADPAARAHTRELVQTLLDYHGAGLAKMLDVMAGAGAAGGALIEELARDDLVGSLLLLYGLHPLGLEARVRQALDKVRPYLRSHGGNVELAGIEGGVVRLRMQGSCDGCPSSAQTLKHAIEEAIYETAPDVTAIEAEGPAQPPLLTASDRGKVALPLVAG